MATPTRHDIGDRFDRSNFLSTEIPPVVFAATQYMRFRDAGVEGPRLTAQALTLLTHLKDEFKNEARDLPEYLLRICLNHRAVELGRLTQYQNRPPPFIYDAIKEQCSSAQPPFCYGHALFPKPDKQTQERNFRRDVITHLDSSLAHIERLSVLDAPTSKALESVALFVIEFTGKSLNKEQERVKPASLYARLIEAAQVDPALTIRFCLHNFATSLESKWRRDAPVMLTRQLNPPNPTLSQLIVDTAKEQIPFGEAPLSQDQRRTLIGDLQRGLRGPDTYLRFLMRPFAVEDAETATDVNRALPHGTPEWLQTLFINGRLNRPELETFSQASQRIKERLGTATT